MRPKTWCTILAAFPLLLCGQSQNQNQTQTRSDLQQILERLERLERENRDLANEVRALRSELGPRGAAAQAAAASPAVETAEPAAATEGPPVAEQVAVHDRRIDEMSQSKVEASQKLPVKITGMLLFNAFLNGRASDGRELPVQASLADSSTTGGARVNQTIIGLAFQGPTLFGGGKTSGFANMDFFGGSADSLNHLFRLRTAVIRIDWKNRSLMFGQEKPIIAPRDPTSLAEVAFSPLTRAGNLWLWLPQARFNQRISLGRDMGVDAAIGVLQTRELDSFYVPSLQNAANTARPSLEGRFEVWRRWGESARIEIAPGFHVSQTHLAGTSVPSRIFSVDWLIRPFAKLDLTGTFFQGTNTAVVGGLPQGVTLLYAGSPRGVHSVGGWTQVSYAFTSRLSVNVFAGQESNRASELAVRQITRNLTYAGNLIYRAGPNVLIGLEARQTRTNYLGIGPRLNNHYDVALAYLF